MIEVAALLGLFGVALAVLFVAAIGWLVVKLLFKIVLFPITLALGALKIGVFVLLGLITLLVAPVLLLVAAALLIPLLIVAAVVGLGVAVFAIAT